MMDLQELIKFLGYTTAYEPFDTFLHKNGVKKRPNLEFGGFLIFPKKTGLALEFTPNAEKYGILKKCEGSITFRRVECNLLEDEDHGRYSGILPWSLNLKMNRDGVRTALGMPQLSLEDRCDKFFLDGLIASFIYTNKTIQLSRFDIAMPNTKDLEMGLCP
ncbi:MAG: hypothetical protein JZU64_15815 [Rhodoferax sp.]|nr:hypothetical protein [Rhodoferax sp.]